MDYKKKYLKYKKKYTNIKNILKGGTTITEQEENNKIKNQAEQDINEFLKTVNFDEQSYTTKLDDVTKKLNECYIKKEELEEKNKDLNIENIELRKPDFFSFLELFRISPNQPKEHQI